MLCSHMATKHLKGRSTSKYNVYTSKMAPAMQEEGKGERNRWDSSGRAEVNMLGVFDANYIMAEQNTGGVDV